MDRKNTALGREFVDTEFVRDENHRVVDRVKLPCVPREYTIAGRYTRALTDEEVARQFRGCK